MISIVVHDQLPDAEPLSMAEMVTALCGVTMAGHKTLIDTVGNGLAVLLNPRSRWQQLCADPTLIPGMVDEVLRFDPPLQGVFRTTTTEVIVAGVTIPASERVYLLWGSGNRDDGFFAHPDEFDMRRSRNRHLTFGHGPHFCVGAPLARLEAHILFEQLTSRFQGLRLIDAGALRREAPVVGFHGYDDLPVAW
jgi:cytochrome P450